MPDIPDDSTGRSMLRRRLMIGAAVALLLAVAAFAALAALVPSERIARAASGRAEAMLGVEVQIGTVDLDFFPLPGVALERLRIGEDDDPAVTVERAVLRPRLLPLLSGRVLVDRVALARPSINIAVDSAGNSALPGFGDPGDEAADVVAGAPAEGGRSIEFGIRSLQVDDGALAFSDARDGTVVRIDGIRQRVRLDGRVEAGELARIRLDGTLDLDSIAAELPGRLAAPVRGLPLSVRHVAELDRGADRLIIEAVDLTLDRIALAGAGRVEALSDTIQRSVTLDLSADEIAFADLIGSLPPGFVDAFLPTAPAAFADAADGASAEGPSGDRPLPRSRLDGRASARLSVNGPVAGGALPAVDGAIELSDVSAETDVGRVFEAVGGTIVFSLDSLASADIDGRLFGEPFGLAFAVRDFADPLIDVSAAGAASLDRVAGLMAGGELEASGRVPFDLRGRARAGAPADARIDGTVGLAGVRVAGGDLGAPVRVDDGRISFEGRTLRLDAVRLQLGDGPVSIDATADGWMPRVLGDTTAVPTVRFDAAAGELDLDALLGPSESAYPRLLFARLAGRPLDGRDAADVAEAQGLAMPRLPAMDAQGRVRADRVVRNGLEYRDLDARVVAGVDGVSVPRARFGFMGGGVELSAALSPAEDGRTDLLLDYALADVEAESFFANLTPLRERFTGRLRLAGTLAARLDEHALPERTTLQADGDAAFRDGRLAGWPLLGAIGERLGLADFDPLAFHDWTGHFRVEGSRIVIEESLQDALGLDGDIAGWFDVGGDLELHATVHLPVELARRAAAPIRSAVQAMSDESGRVPVGLRIGGAADRPDIALDLDAARRSATARAREAAEAEARNAAGRAMRGLAERTGADTLRERVDSMLPGDSLRRLVTDSAARAAADSVVRQAADSLRRRATDSLLNRTGAGGLIDRAQDALPFLRRGGRQDTTAADTLPADSLPADSLPPDSIPPDAARPDSARPDTAPPDTGRSETIAGAATAAVRVAAALVGLGVVRRPVR